MPTKRSSAPAGAAPAGPAPRAAAPRGASPDASLNATPTRTASPHKATPCAAAPPDTPPPRTATPRAAAPRAATARSEAPGHTPMAFVRAIAQAYAQRGLDAAAVLQRAAIDPAALHRPHARVTAAQFERLCHHAMQELDDEAPGWFARPMRWGSYGMLARASISAPTLGLALKRWCKHHNLLVPDVALRLEDDEGVATVSIAECGPLGAGGALREFALLALLRNIYGLACWWVDSRIALHEAAFAFDAPPHAGVYPLLFAGPVAFAQPHTRIRFDADYLALPLRRDDAALAQMLRRALPIMVLPYRRDRLLVQRVRQLLRPHSRLGASAAPSSSQTAQTLAERLAMSARTLHRQLHAEGASLQALKDEVRLQQAQTLLLRTSRPIKQVAAISGFQNEKSFARAFRQWTGQAPSEFRQQGQLKAG